MQRKFGENTDSLLAWSKGQDTYLRLFSALKLDEMDHPFAIPALVNSIGLYYTIPSKKPILVSSTHPFPANMRLQQRPESDWPVIIKSIVIQLRTPQKLPGWTSFDILEYFAFNLCKNDHPENLSECWDSISKWRYSLNVNFPLSDPAEYEAQYQTKLKPLFTQWFEGLISQD